MTDNPLRDQRSLPPRRTNEELKLVELRDDRNPIPPSIGGSAFTGIFFGPLANQPSTSKNESTKPKSNWIPLIVILTGIATFFTLSYFYGRPKRFHYNQNTRRNS